MLDFIVKTKKYYNFQHKYMQKNQNIHKNNSLIAKSNFILAIIVLLSLH